MNNLAITVPIGLGDIIYLKAMLDNVKPRFNQIKIKFHREIIQSYLFSPDYHDFLNEIGTLFFSEPPYVLTSEPDIPFYGMVSICNDNKICPIKPNLRHLLCKGEPLKIDSEYIVIVTKVRYLSRIKLDTRVSEMWHLIRELSKKYKVVILGERQVQMNPGYMEIGKNDVYSIYDSIIANIPSNRIVDLSVPALGISSPKLSHIQQDCVIMSGAKFVLTLGIGGGFCMATAVGNTLGYRMDDDPIADVVFGNYHESSNTFICKNWDLFIRQLRRHL